MPVSRRLAIIAPHLLPGESFSVSELFLHEALPQLKKGFEIDLFSQAGGVSGGLSSFAVHRLSERDEQKNYLAVLAFLEDRPESLFSRFALNALPGAIIVIDAILDRLFESAPWGFIDPKFEPILQQVLAPSEIVVTTNSHSLHAVRAASDKARFGTVVPVSTGERRRSGVRDKILIGFAARYFIEERAFVVIDALIELAQENLSLKWICGFADKQKIIDFVRTESERRQINLNEMVEVVAISSIETERKALADCEIFISLKGDLLRSPSTSLFHSLALGIPSIVLEFGPAAEFPDEVILKLRAGRGEVSALVAAIRHLVNNEPLRLELGRRGQDYIRTVHCPTAVAADLFSVLESITNSSTRMLDIKRERYKNLELQSWL